MARILSSNSLQLETPKPGSETSAMVELADKSNGSEEQRVSTNNSWGMKLIG
jgi:hypothetical protein